MALRKVLLGSVPNHMLVGAAPKTVRGAAPMQRGLSGAASRVPRRQLRLVAYAGARTSYEGLRGLSTEPLSMVAYHAAADEALETILDATDELEEAREDVECEFSSGVMTITRSDGSWVINKQAPNKQIWLSSPVRSVSVALRRAPRLAPLLTRRPGQRPL